MRKSYLWLLALLEECLLARLLLVLLGREISVLADLVDRLAIQALQLNLHRGSNDVARVDPP